MVNNTIGMAATTGCKNDSEFTHPFQVASNSPTKIPRPTASAVSSLSGSGGIRKSTSKLVYIRSVPY